MFQEFRMHFRLVHFSSYFVLNNISCNLENKTGSQPASKPVNRFRYFLGQEVVTKSFGTKAAQADRKTDRETDILRPDKYNSVHNCQSKYGRVKCNSE